MATSRPPFKRGPPLSKAGGAMGRVNSATAADSSDDDISLAMVPMKFSALTNALLNDEASSIESSSPAPGRYRGSTAASRSRALDAVSREPGTPQRSFHPISHTPSNAASQRTVSTRVVRLGSGSPRSATLRRATSTPSAQTPGSPKATSDTTTPSRVVRLSGGRSGSATHRRSRSSSSAPLSGAKEDVPGHGTHQELITPAPRPRTDLAKHTVESPALKVFSGSHDSMALNASNVGEDAMGRLGTMGRSQVTDNQDSGPHLGASTVGRARQGEDGGMHGSIRVKRVGKVTGAFLSGPARRGRRRQSEEEQSPRQHSSGRRSPEHIPVPNADVPSDVALQPDIKEDEPPTIPPFKVPTLPPSLPSNHDQENEPPPTFKRSRPSALSLLARAEGATSEKKMLGTTPSTASPHRPALAPRSQNTAHRAAPPPPKMSILETATAAGANAASQSRKKRTHISINQKTFMRMDCIGRGGSSRVYRVMAENSRMFALKKVALEGLDESTIKGYKGEIDLLKRLEHVDRVVTLYDYEVNDEKKTLSVLMEIGDIDLDRLLRMRLNAEDARYDISFGRYYWKEMLECVQAIHQFDIVHSDLKPANFLLVSGRLRLIDFGIANMIQDDTVNVHREQTVGTPNYMAPETLEDTNAKLGLPASSGKMMKLGKPSDVWSLGCILYQMVYGKAPFANLTNQIQRIMAITNPDYVISFPATGLGGLPVPSGLLRTMKGCLNRDQQKRPTIDQLLHHNDPFLYPDLGKEAVVEVSQELLGRILSNVVNHCQKDGIPTEAEMAAWPAAFFEKIKSLA